MIPLIGVTGLARAGKDSLARILVERHGYKRVAFADALKEAVAAIAGEPVILFHSDVSKEEFSTTLGTTRRKALQVVGAAVRDNLDEMVWVRRAVMKWNLAGCPPTVISDVRYENEAKAILELGGCIIKLNRPGAGLTGEAAAHKSEAGIPGDLVTVEIQNDGTLGELAHEAHKLAAFVGA